MLQDPVHGLSLTVCGYTMVRSYCKSQALLLTKKYKSALTKEGLLHAWILGCILGATLGLPAWTTCTVYLIVGSIATKIKKAEKEAQGIAGSFPNSSMLVLVAGHAHDASNQLRERWDSAAGRHRLRKSLSM